MGHLVPYYSSSTSFSTTSVMLHLISAQQDISTGNAIRCSIRMRIGIVACEVLKNEIESLVENDPDIVHKDYLEFALHVYSEDMRRTIVEKVDQLEGMVDAVLIGYAVCQSLDGLDREVKVPSIMLEGDDCISVLLGPTQYAGAKAECTGTWFSSPGWAELGMSGVIKELHLDSMLEEGFGPEYFLDIIFDAYKRCLYIDTGVGDRESLERLSFDFARQLRLPHESRCGTLENLDKALRRTKELAQCVINGTYHGNG